MHVVATAGHVDHGKSTLVRALTGIEPDRWAEEHRRGMTIDLGYAWTTLASGADVAFVDVPGHQRFIGNMLAGLGPAPAVLLVGLLLTLTYALGLALESRLAGLVDLQLLRPAVVTAIVPGADSTVVELQQQGQAHCLRTRLLVAADGTLAGCPAYDSCGWTYQPASSISSAIVKTSQESSVATATRVESGAATTVSCGIVAMPATIRSTPSSVTRVSSR